MKYLSAASFCLAILLNTNSLMAQRQIGEWTTYLSHNEASGVVAQNTKVYGITAAGMFSYDFENKEIRTFSTIDGMSGINATTIYYAEEADLVFMGYDDGSIDYFNDPSRFSYFTDIARNTTFISKGIRNFHADANELFVGTDFGLVIYDLTTGLPKTDITQFADNGSRQPITSVTTFDNRIWVIVEGAGLYSAPRNASNLKDPTLWIYEPGMDNLSDTLEITAITANNAGIYALSSPEVYTKSPGGSWSEKTDFKGTWVAIHAGSDYLSATENRIGKIQYQDGMTYTTNINGNVNDIAAAGRGRYYFSTQNEGVREWDHNEQAIVSPDGPYNNSILRMAAGNGALYVAPNGYDQAFVPDPSRLGLFYYHPDNGWIRQSLDNDGVPEDIGTGFARAYFDHSSGNTFMGSYGRGMVEYQDGVWINAFNCANSGISVIFDPCNLNSYDNSRVSGIDRDINGNLWVSLDFAQPPLVVMTPDGEWYQTPTFMYPNNHHVVGMIADDYGSKWMLNARQGLLVYNDNNTPADMGDDRLVSLKTGLNQGNLPSNEVYSIAKDHDGFIWVGTGTGVTVFYDPFNIGQGTIVDASTPVFERRPLLKDALIRAIAVDGGNRKWIGTNDGIFLVSEDGDEVIHQFNIDNSPLLANQINDIAIDHSTGEVFIGTSKGIISYQGDATAGADPCEEVMVFPNPVFPEFEGMITIRGSAAESYVKITTISGLLVQEVQSQGGTAVWDGRDLYGNQVQAGVYLALIANRNGENACIGKFTVIR